MASPIVFDYLDYRLFLSDMYAYRKQKDGFFSYRYFSGKAGFASPNFLKLVIEGQRNLTNTSIAKVAKGFGLKKEERRFFENLVFMNQAKGHEEKTYYLKRMMSIKGYLKIRRLEKQSYDYFSHWFNPVIREVVMFGEQDFSAETISTLLIPEVSVTEVKKALGLLQELGLIKRTVQGRWEQADPVISTGPEVKSLAVADYHRQAIKLGAGAIERFPAQERDVSALTLRVNGSSIQKIKQRIARFRRELLAFALEEESPDQVFQVNFQAFPLTKRYKKERGE